MTSAWCDTPAPFAHRRINERTKSEHGHGRELDPDLAGLSITGTGDVFAPGGDMGGGGGADDWITFGAALGMDVTPFDAVRTSAKPMGEQYPWKRRS